MKLYLSKVYNRGPAPCITINNKIKNLIDINKCKDSNKLANYVLTEFYIDRRFSQQKIADLFDVQHDTIRRWLDRLNIPVRSQGDSVSLAITKYHKNLFSGNLVEKAYLLGLRCGDLSAQKHGRNIRIDVSSTHPDMLRLFEDVFSAYGKIGIYPKFDKKPLITRFHSYQWKIYCDVDKSFEFILKKCDRIPRWIKEDEKLFYSFLSGYFDAEGCLNISYNKSNNSSLLWTIHSTDKHILKDIYDFLLKRGFNVNMKLAKEADGIEYNKDYWSITVCMKIQVLKLLKNMKLKHMEKIIKHNLALELINTSWKGADSKIRELRKSIKNGVRKCVESAKKEYVKRHPSLQ